MSDKMTAPGPLAVLLQQLGEQALPGTGHNSGLALNADDAVKSPPLADDSMETAGELSLFLFGVNDYAHRRKIYRWASEKNPEDRLPVTRRGSILRGRRSVIKRWLAAREAAATR
jgi:hypothetical protein